MNAIKGHRSNHCARVVLSPGETSSEDKGVDFDIKEEGLGRYRRGEELSKERTSCS